MSAEPKIVAPWTAEQVAALNRFQELGHVHPYTCAHGCGPLAATGAGWLCLSCNYSQNCAWADSADPDSAIWENPLARCQK